MPKKALQFVLVLVAISFFISANSAWLNPRPNFNPLATWNNYVPLLWQYNLDVETFLNTASNFPESYHDIPTLIQRPAYIFFASVVGDAIKWFIPGEPQGQHAVMAGYLIVNLVLYALMSVCFLKLISRFASTKAAKFGLAFFLFHFFSWISLGQYHTNFLQFVTPVLIVFLFDDLARNYSTRKNLLYSFWIGVLMLAKENYAVYLACLGVALWHKKYKEVITSFGTHLFPLLLWLITLKVYAIPYYHHGFEYAGAISWLGQDFIYQSLLQMIKTVGHSMLNFGIEFTRFYSIFALLGVMGLAYLAAQKKIQRGVLFFIVLFVGTTWLQMFVSNRPLAYMTADLGFLVFGIGAIFLLHLMEPWRLLKKKAVLPTVAGLWLFVNIIGVMNFPWAHPYEQHEYGAHEITNLEAYLSQNPSVLFQFNKTFTGERFVNRWGKPEPWVRKVYIASGEFIQPLPEPYTIGPDGCHSYLITTPYIMNRGHLTNTEPNEVESTSFGLVDGEWVMIPTQNELVLDFNMHNKGSHEMIIDSSKISGGWGGYSQIIYVDEQKVVGDLAPNGYPYDLVLYEDGVPLLYPHTTDVQAIIEKGMGRYMIRDDGLIIFSSSDNSDPHTNGRKYTATYTVFSSFMEPYSRTDYRLRLCSKDPNDPTFEENITVTTQIQFPRALVPVLKQKAKISSQIVLQQ